MLNCVVREHNLSSSLIENLTDHHVAQVDHHRIGGVGRVHRHCLGSRGAQGVLFGNFEQCLRLAQPGCELPQGRVCQVLPE